MTGIDEQILFHKFSEFPLPPYRQSMFWSVWYNYIMNPPFDPLRQIATQDDSPASQPDISKYTYSVAETVIAFREASMSITDRTIQRYCHRGKHGKMNFVFPVRKHLLKIWARVFEALFAISGNLKRLST